MSSENDDEQIDTHDQIAQRRAKLAALRARGNAYPNDFRRDALSAEVHARFGEKDAAALDGAPNTVTVAGRLMTRRIMGRAAFAHLQDMSGRIQLYVKRDDVGEEAYEAFRQWDLGDILGAEGFVFKTRSGELSIHVKRILLLTKSLRPLPEKFHGLTDHETRYRQRYLDLIVNEETRRVFAVRSAAIDFVRGFLRERGFLEVETPMMQVLPGGAAARPFVTHHNALDMDLYLRIAPELYLKRLVVGGFDRVFELNRNFRNEGLSTRHNPEFTTVEFYQAYADYNDLINLIEEMIRSLVRTVLGGSRVASQGESYDLDRPFARMTVKESILHYNPDIRPADLEDLCAAREVARRLQIPVRDGYGLGKVQIEIFEKTVEARLKEPTFITAFPAEVSPLARRSDADPFLTDRFEFFIGGRELANGFSELNDPEDQADRFRGQAQAKEAGDEEAMFYDADYIEALEYGMPPTAGAGVGIDRLVMLLTDSPSIRDVLLFPHMRPKAE